ncbi:hypothetical protein E2C01_057726 [Portunus trituberculatus]|uniref:Uncharacterized protein n=1 Tax=Portunus trituberculatus TaxID=210409 RepID=A0A5B7H199_PORTR|nr:hypothetical protein [Portunus trituberculatus]
MCAVYFSPITPLTIVNSFDYLTSNVEHILDLHSWRFQCSPPALAFLSLQ